MAKAHLLPHLAGEALDLERRRVGVGELVGGANADLELARRHLGVDRLGRAAHDRAGDGDHVLGAERVPERERFGRLVGVEDELHEPGAVTQVDEDDAAVVAAAMDPAGDPNLGIDGVCRGRRRTTCRGSGWR